MQKAIVSNLLALQNFLVRKLSEGGAVLSGPVTTLHASSCEVAQSSS